MVCPSHFAFKEAQAAMGASDPAWLRQIGCSFADQGLKIALIDAPVATGPPMTFGTDASTRQTVAPLLECVLLRPRSCNLCQLWAIPSNRADAERETKPLIERLRQAVRGKTGADRATPYEIIGSPGGAYRADWPRNAGVQMRSHLPQGACSDDRGRSGPSRSRAR